MRKITTSFLFIFIFDLYLKGILGQLKGILGQTSDCNGNGHIEEEKCICGSSWSGEQCQTEIQIVENNSSNYNESNFYDWTEISLQKRVERLYNIVPKSKEINDLMFPQNDSSLKVVNVSMNWTSLKDIDKQAKLWDKTQKLSFSESIQGSFENSYLFASLAYLLNITGGEGYVRAAIPYYDEVNSIYVTKWYMFGRYIYVSVNDFIPTLNGFLYGAQLPRTKNFWAAILEKAWAKIFGSYEAITELSDKLFINSLPRIPEKNFFGQYATQNSNNAKQNSNDKLGNYTTDQIACQANGCYGRGLCTPKGTCILCLPGYTGDYCQNNLI